MTGAVSVPGAVQGARGAGARATGEAFAARVALGALLRAEHRRLGGLAAAGCGRRRRAVLAGRSPVVAAADAAGSTWARAIAAAAPASEPLSQAVLDYGFSMLNLVLAGRPAGRRGASAEHAHLADPAAGRRARGVGRGVQPAGPRRRPGDRGGDRAGRDRACTRSCCTASPAPPTSSRCCVFPSPSWDGLPGARPAPRRRWSVVGAVTFLLVGLGTALLPHTTSCVLFFGFLVPAVGLVVLPRRVRRGPGRRGADPGPPAVQHARRRLRGGDRARDRHRAAGRARRRRPGLTLVDPTAHGAPALRRPDRAAVLVLAAGVGRDRGRRAGRHPARPAVDRRALVQPRARGAARDVGRGRRVRRAARDRRRRARRHRVRRSRRRR